MERYRNKEVRKYLTLFVISSVLALVGIAVFMYYQFENYRSKENQAVEALLCEIMMNDEDVDLNDYLKILNHVSDSWNEIPDKTKQELEVKLTSYGFDENSYNLAEMKQAQNHMILGSILFLFLVEGVLFVICYFYIRKRSQAIQELTGYMELVSKGKYSLDLADNSEDELSNLKNELYKVSIRLKEQALNSQNQKKMLADSVADISHQLKTPLTSASILLDNLNDNDHMDEETQKRFIREISKQVFSMNWMILSMLKLSRLQAGVVELKQEKYSVNEMLEEVLDKLEVIAQLKEIIIRKIGFEQGVTLVGDRIWNGEAVTNIIKNAIEHSEDGAQITIKLEDNSVYTAIHVSNYGEPISKEQQKRIFERFYSVSNEANQNVGIGLPLAKAIVERQNGYLTVETNLQETTFILKYHK